MTLTPAEFAHGSKHGLSHRVECCDTDAGSAPHGALARALSADESWEMIVAHRIPVVITGSPRSIDALINELTPLLHAPVVHLDCRSDLPVNVFAAGTVLFHNLDRCVLDAQRELLQWIDGSAFGTQIVSTSSRSLVSLIATSAVSRNAVLPTE